MARLRLSSSVVALLWSATSCWASEEELLTLMLRMESMALDLRDKVEEAYSLRCGITESDCAANHHYDCVTQFPEPSCLSGGSWDVGACLDKDSNCGALWDFTTSGVSIPDDVGGDTPSDTEVIETVCYSQLIDDFLVDEFETGQTSGDDFEFLGMFFGAWNGVFRIYPGRQREECGNYDPRYRPWYVAASSGPKNVIILIDTSGSMATSDRLQLAMEAATDVLSTLTVADYVAVIQFNSDAELLLEDSNDGEMVQATAENIEALIAEVNELSDSGATNFEDAFELAFDVLDESFANEANTNCETAILFLTDGEPTVGTGSGGDEDDLYSLIGAWNMDYGAKIFSYSLGNGASLDIPKAISCQENGTWTYVPDGGNLRDKMAGFYTYFAAGIGTKANRNFTAWVEPYEFASGGYYGTTVSAPVYGTSTSPWRFLGAVGIDFSVSYMEEVVGGSDAYTTVLDALESASSSFCPEPNLSECDVQAIRDAASYSSSYDSTCDDQCSSFSSLTPESCMASSEYPTGAELWDNYDYEGKSYSTRVCCGNAEEDNDTIYESCRATTDTTTIMIIIIVLSDAVFLGLVGWICCYCRKKRMRGRFSDGARNNSVQQQQHHEPVAPVLPPNQPQSYYPQQQQVQQQAGQSVALAVPVEGGGVVAYAQPVYSAYSSSQ